MWWAIAGAVVLILGIAIFLFLMPFFADWR